MYLTPTAIGSHSFKLIIDNLGRVLFCVVFFLPVSLQHNNLAALCQSVAGPHGLQVNDTLSVASWQLVTGIGVSPSTQTKKKNDAGRE